MKTFTTFLLILLFSSSTYGQQLELELIASGLGDPLEIQNAGDNRLFIADRNGLIKILDPATGNVNSNPFLDISNLVLAGGEQGLLGLTFHPDYGTNGYFYVYYTNTNGDSQISRFTANGFNPDVADPNSELQMLSFTQPFGNHNGGHLAFGPDGKLYIASGDGGSGGDPQNNAQNLTNLLGKILRLDVDIAAPYIPADNPFVNNSNAMDEIWAYGLRNPWKFSFDTTASDLWIADVGQNAWEEINKEPINTAGLNYGWRCYEGNHTFNTTGCPAVSELTFPFAEYANSGGRCSITGGYVYRGTEFPAIQGLYIFADFCSNEIGTVDASGNLQFHGPFAASSIVSFGKDVSDNLYLASFGNGGSIYKVIDETPLSLGNWDDNSFHLYPNPAYKNINIDFINTDNDSLSIFDLKGNLLYNQNISGEKSVSVSLDGFSAGMYIAVVTNDTGTKNFKKLIVQ